VGHYFAALGPAIGRYREPADQDRFAREEAARFLAVLAQAERERAARLEEPYLRLVPPPQDGGRAMREEGASRAPTACPYRSHSRPAVLSV